MFTCHCGLIWFSPLLPTPPRGDAVSSSSHRHKGCITGSQENVAGTSTGNLTTADQTWNNGGDYLWEINNATGSAGGGSGWDLLTIDGSLDLSGLEPEGFTIDIDSLNLANIAGNAENFVALTDYDFQILAASNEIIGFDPVDFILSDSGFLNSDWLWTLRSENNNSLWLGAEWLGGAPPGGGGGGGGGNAPVPEPSRAVLLLTGTLGMLMVRRRKRRRPGKSD